MKVVNSLEFHTGSKEEKLPDFTPDFPYITTRAELDDYREDFVPWHWHKAIELFYMENGELEYYTPGGTTIAGGYENRIEEKYVTPMITAPQLEIIPLNPDNPVQADILHSIRQAFLLSEQDLGYEIKIRESLSDIWLKLFKLSCPSIQDKAYRYDKSRDKIKLMMIYIHEHYAEKISIQEIASAAYSSERECYRVFQKCLHMTPIEYMKNYRLQIAVWEAAVILEKSFGNIRE